MGLDLTGKFLPQFRQLAHVRLETMRGLLAAGPKLDASALGGQMHAFAGEAAMLGLTSLVEAARDGERLAHDQATYSSTQGATLCAESVQRLSDLLKDETSAQALPSQQASVAPERLRVLVVDDSPLVGEAVCDALVDAGFEVKMAETLADVDASLTDFGPQVVVTDLLMPEFDASDLTRHVRDCGLPQTKVLLVSGLERSELLPEANRVGADGVVSKQQGMDAIVTGVRELIQKP